MYEAISFGVYTLAIPTAALILAGAFRYTVQGVRSLTDFLRGY